MAVCLPLRFPTQIQQSVNPISSYAAVFNLAQGPPGYTFPSIPADGNYPLPDGIYQIARPFKVRLPTVGGWNVMVQQELTPTMSLQVGYIGSHSYHNMFESSPSFNANEQTLAGFNQINPETGLPYTVPERSPYYDGTAQRELGVKYGVPHGWTQRVDYMANLADNSYDAMQVILNKRFSSGLQFLTHYTWSHALGHESYEFLIDPAIGRGNGYYNRRNQYVFAGNYDLPFGRDKAFGSGVSGWMNEIIGGFQLNGTLTWDSGIPFNTSYANCSLDNDVGCQRRCLLPEQNRPGLWHSQGQLQRCRADMFLTSSPSPYILQSPGQPNNSFGGFSRPAPATWGNIGRDSLWGPGLTNVDASLAKNFTLHESSSHAVDRPGFQRI